MELYSLTIYLGQRHRLFKVRFLSLHSTSPFKYLFSPRLKKVLESGREDRKYTSTHYRWAHDGHHDQRKVVKALVDSFPAKKVLCADASETISQPANNGNVSRST